MNKKLIRRLNSSYQKVLRNRHIQLAALTDREYRLYDLYFALYDWDPKHLDTYGEVDFSDHEIAGVLNWSPSKVSRARSRLVKKKMVEQIRNGNHYKIIFEKGASVKGTNAQVQDDDAKKQQSNARMQQNQTHTRYSSIVSFKDKYSLMKTKEDYDRLSKEIDRLSNPIEKQKLAEALLSYEIENDLLPI